MKIAIVAPSPVPFVIGGAEKLWWGLVNALNAQPGVQAELIKVPSPERNFRELVRSYRQFSKLDLAHFDAVISTKYPAWMVSHPNHFLYLQHRLRGLYDTYHFTGLPVTVDPEIRQNASLGKLFEILDGPANKGQMEHLFAEVEALEASLAAGFEEIFRFPGPITRKIIHWLDSVAVNMTAIRGFSAISSTVKARADYFPRGANVQVIHHPSDLPAFRAKTAQQIFTVSRLDNAKRLGLLIEAYRQVDTDFPFVIAGTGPDEHNLRTLAHGDERIRFTGRLTDAEIVEHYSNSLFVPFVPYDEDYGLITVEAMQAGRAVLTVLDAGGVNEFVVNGVSGYSVEPNPESLAKAMQAMLSNPEHTLKMGEAARQKVAHVNWARTTSDLLGLIKRKGGNGSSVQGGQHRPPRTEPRTNKGLRKVLVVSPFRIGSPGSGGQNRVYYLYLAMSRYLDITILSLDSPEASHSQIEFNSHYREVSIPLDSKGREHLHRIDGLLQVDCGDVAMIGYIAQHEEFVEVLKRLANDSEWVVASHPYLYRAIERVYRGKVVYDAHNVEFDMKKSVLAPAADGTSSGGNPEAMKLAADLVQATFDLERDLIARAQLTVACSQNDLDRLSLLYGPVSGALLEAPNGVHLGEIEFLSLAQKRSWQNRLALPTRGELVFFAGSWHGPNIAAMHRVVDLAKQRPAIAFAVMGSVCRHPEFVDTPPNLIKLGQLSNAEKRVILSAATVLLNPMEVGSGTNLKMLEYAASGGSLLSTEFGNRGLGFEPNAEIFVTSAEDLAASLDVVLATSDETRDQMAGKARHRVASQFDWPDCADDFAGHLRWK